MRFQVRRDSCAAKAFDAVEKVESGAEFSGVTTGFCKPRSAAMLFFRTIANGGGGAGTDLEGHRDDCRRGWSDGDETCVWNWNSTDFFNGLISFGRWQAACPLGLLLGRMTHAEKALR